MSLNSQYKIKTYYKKLQAKNPVELLIGILLVVFMISYIFYSFKIFRFDWIALSPDAKLLATKPWTIITYGFFHSRFIALFFNLVLIFYFGNIFIDFLSNKKFWLTFFAGVLFGAIFFVYSFKFFPKMFINKGALLGSSAGIMAIMTYISSKFPHYQIRFRFLGDFKLIYILIFFIAFNLLQIPLGNPGGYFAHLGGLLAGFLFFVVDKFLEKKQKISTKINVNDESIGKNYKMNIILDKINRSGYESLTDEEKEFLFRQGKK